MGKKRRNLRAEEFTKPNRHGYTRSHHPLLSPIAWLLVKRRGPATRQEIKRFYDTNLREQDAITPTEYRAFQEAYDFFNAELFGGALPNVLVTLQRHAKAYPSSTGQPGGQETGQKVSHYVIEGGPYARSFARLEAKGSKLRWQSRAAADDPARKKKAASKTKYACPECGPNAWAKPDAQLICGECYEDGEGEICMMEAEG